MIGQAVHTNLCFLEFAPVPTSFGVASPFVYPVVLPFILHSQKTKPRFGEAASLELLLAKGMGMDASRSGYSVTCMVGQPGSLLACRQTGLLVMVVATSTFNFVGWSATVVGHNQNGLLQAELHRLRDAISWHGVDDFQDWLAAPAKTVLHNAFGALILEHSAEAMDLPHAMIAEGLSLTIKQCEVVLQHYGWTETNFKKQEGALRAGLFPLLADTIGARGGIEKIKPAPAS